MKTNITLKAVLRLLAFALLAFYILFILGFAWLQANAMIRPARHEICCASPADLGLEYESITLTTEDDLRLYGWYIPSQNGAVIILLHGYGGNRTSMLPHAEMLAGYGFGVLMYDQRASGESDGESLSWGWRDVGDVGAVLDFLSTKQGITSGGIGILGCSTGAEIALGASARFDKINAVIADGPYYATTSDTWPPYGLKDWLGWPVYPAFITFMEWKSGTSAPMSLRDASAAISPRPLLFITAGEVGYEQWRVEQYLSSAGEPKEHWVVPNATHCAGPTTQPGQYRGYITSFFGRALLNP